MAVEIEEPDTLVVSPSERLEDEDIDVVVAPRSPGLVLPVVHTSLSAELVTERGGHRVVLTVDSTHVETPPVEHLAFYAGLGVLVGVGLVELPIAVALGIGHILIDITRRPGLQALAEALEEA
jgi:hypothetical protein